MVEGISSLLVKSMIEKQTITYIKKPMAERMSIVVVGGQLPPGKPPSKPPEQPTGPVDCSGSIGSRIVVVLAEAIEQVSSGDMSFTVRNLFYAVRELHSKRFPNCKFYKKYDSFSQDFLRSFEKRYGKIRGLTRMPRGKYVTPQEGGENYELDIKPGMRFIQGCANKVIMVEKEGLYTVMKENSFDVRLDVVLAYTSGFTTEAGRNMLIDAQRRGLNVCILRDYDVAGILIYETLTKPTKRLDTFLDGDKLYDLGLNWEVIQKIRETRTMTPESVKLNQSHTTALQNMLDDGTVSWEEYELLKDSRIELNQLTPLELLEWLEKRLDGLGLWKTIPEQVTLDDALGRHIDEQLKAKTEERSRKLKDTLLKGFKVYDVFDKLLELSIALGDRTGKEVTDIIDGLKFPELSVKDLEKLLRDDPMRFWTAAMESESEEMIDELNEDLDKTLKEPDKEMMTRVKEREKVTEALTAVETALEAWFEEREDNAS